MSIDFTPDRATQVNRQFHYFVVTLVAELKRTGWRSSKVAAARQKIVAQLEALATELEAAWGIDVSITRGEIKKARGVPDETFRSPKGGS